MPLSKNLKGQKSSLKTTVILVDLLYNAFCDTLQETHIFI